MVMAELHNKLGQDGAAAHERLEDVLTSNVFGLLRYLPPVEGLGCWLSQAVPVSPGAPKLQIAASELKFWPRLSRGELDVLAVVRSDDGNRLDLVGIECKLHSTKSGAASDAKPEEERFVDQLAKYAVALEVDNFAALAPSGIGTRSLIYLTADAALPRDELDETLGALDSACRTRIYWLSWDALWPIADRLAGFPWPTGLIARDLRDLLTRKNLRPFSGFLRLAAKVPRESQAHWRRRWTHLSNSLPLSAALHPAWRTRWRGFDLPDLPQQRPIFWRINE